MEQKKFYNQEVSVGYQILLTLSTQIIGYGLAGIARRYLVRPPSMIWPGLLASTAMFSTLHKSENKIADGWSISRWKFFLYVWLGAFLWYFVPGLLFPALSYCNVITWFAPDNVTIANLVRGVIDPYTFTDSFSSASRPGWLFSPLPLIGLRSRILALLCYHHGGLQ